jgi:acyl-CoA reductase-like NAD-dependent aldehyde dehydrogenase
LRDASKKLGGELSSDLYIDGAWRTGTGRDLIDVIDPYDNQEICRIAPGSIDQVDDAVEAAHRAFHAPAWKAMTGRARGELLFRLAQLLRRDLELFASIDTGIPIRETRMEVATSAFHLEYFAGLAGKIEGSYQDLGARFNYLRREPLV